MSFIFLLALMIGFIAFPRYCANTPIGWALSLTVWLTIIKASWILFIALWWVCWNASDEQWRHDMLISPLRSMMDKFLSSDAS